MKAALAQAHAERKAQGLGEIAATKDALKDAKDTHADLNGEPKVLKGLVIDNGDGTVRRLGTDEIQAHMHAVGADPTAYVRMTPPNEGFRNAVANWKLSRGGSKGPRYTGASLKTGSYQPGYGILAQSQLASELRLQRAITHDDFATQMALAHSDGSLQRYTEHEAQHAAAAYEKEYGIPVTAVYDSPKSLTQAQHDNIAGMQDKQAAEQQLARDTMQNRIVPTHAAEGEVAGNGPRNVLLVPTTQVNRYLKHVAVDTSGNKTLMAINRKFRNTVLPTSTKWPVMHGIETPGRALLGGIGPKDLIRGYQVLQSMRDQGLGAEADRLENISTGGTHFAQQDQANREQMDLPGAGPRPLHPLTGAVGQLPVIKQVAAGYNAYTTRVFRGVRALEVAASKAALGSHVEQQIQELAVSWAKAHAQQGDLLHAVARGYADPRMVSDAARSVQAVFGKYNAFSPVTRRFIRSASPFAPWYLNAAKFVYHTLPVGHPLTSAILQSVNRAEDPSWVANHNVPHSSEFGIPTGSLLSEIKTGPSDYVDVGRYGPFGAFTQGPSDYFTNLAVPQLSGAIRNLAGQDAFGTPLKGPQGAVTDKGQWALQAVNSLLEGFGGPLSVGERIIENHGSTAYNTSKLWAPQLKPDTHHGPPGLLGGLQRVLNPFEPTHLAKVVTPSSVGAGKIIPERGKIIGSGGKIIGSGGKIVGR